MFIKLPNNYFQCKLHLIAIILHLNDFLNPPTVFVCINAFQTYISKFMMILLVYVLVGFQFLRKTQIQCKEKSSLNEYSFVSFCIMLICYRAGPQAGISRVGFVTASRAPCDKGSQKPWSILQSSNFQALRSNFRKVCFSILIFQDFHQTLHQFGFRKSQFKQNVDFNSANQFSRGVR